MENKEDILKKLNSQDITLLQEAINEIKANGDLSIIPSLLDITESCDNHDIKNKIINLLADIKENGFKDILIQRIKETTNPAMKAVLLRICWESALDFSGNMDLFAEIILKDDLEVALEASTVIEETIHNLSDEKRAELVKKLQTDKQADNKQFLTEDLLSQLR